MPSDEATVFVVDDDPAQRDSLRWLMESVGLPAETFASAEGFLEAYDPTRAGCLVVDVRLPGMSGLTLQTEMVSRGIILPVIVITGYGDVPAAVRAVKAGAFHFVEKPISDQVLLDSIRQAIAADGDRRRVQADREATRLRAARLTPRERQIMDMLVTGKANKAVAIELGISERTVETHRSRIMMKMKVESMAELVNQIIFLDT